MRITKDLFKRQERNGASECIKHTNDRVNVKKYAKFKGLIFVGIMCLSMINGFSQTYTIDVSAEPTIGGSVSGDGTYNNGDPVSLTATPNPGYEFVKWTINGDSVSVDNPYNFVAISDSVVVANFVLKTYTITVLAAPSTDGSVTGDGTYSHGDNVNLTAIPNVGYEFLKWTINGDSVSADNPYIFVADSDVTIVANFDIKTYNIAVSVEPLASGSVTGDGIYSHGNNVSLTATPNTGYRFIKWTINNVSVSIDNPYDFTAENAVTLVANFNLDTQYNILALVNPTAGGSVSGSNAYYHDDTVELRATPNTGYIFINWTKEGGVVASTDSIYRFVATKADTLTAYFEK